MSEQHLCVHCGTGETDDPETELRPYGPGGAWVCYRCAMSTPEREAEAERAFTALLEAAAVPTGIAAIGDTDGPQPFYPGEAPS